MIHIEENTGLICGFRFAEDGTVSPIAWEEMDQALAQEGGTVWLHFHAVDLRVRSWLARSAHLPPAAAEVLVGSHGHLWLEPVGQGIGGVLGDLHADQQTAPSAVGVLRLYLDSRCLITARQEPLRAIESLRRAVTGDDLRVGGATHLVVHLLHHLASSLGAAMGELGEELDGIEDRLLTGVVHGHGEKLSRIRRTVAQLRRHIVPQRQALAGMLGQLPAWLAPADAAALRQAVERLAAVGHDLDFVQERAFLLQSERNSRLAEMTNRNLYILSIVTTVFLPLSLISGIFGMNTGGLPGQQDPIGFWWVLVSMGVCAVISLVLLHWKRLF